MTGINAFFSSFPLPLFKDLRRDSTELAEVKLRRYMTISVIPAQLCPP